MRCRGSCARASPWLGSRRRGIRLTCLDRVWGGCVGPLHSRASLPAVFAKRVQGPFSPPKKAQATKRPGLRLFGLVAALMIHCPAAALPLLPAPLPTRLALPAPLAPTAYSTFPNKRGSAFDAILLATSDIKLLNTNGYAFKAPGCLWWCGLMSRAWAAQPLPGGCLAVCPVPHVVWEGQWSPLVGLGPKNEIFINFLTN